MARHPLGMAGGIGSYHSVREVFFDTTDGVLAEQGMTLRLRADLRGSRVLCLSTVRSVNLQGVTEEVVLEVPVTHGGLYEALSGTSAPATRIRDMMDPVALRPQVALDIDREERTLRSRWTRRPMYRVWFDRVVAHRGSTTRDFCQIRLTPLQKEREGLERVAARLHTRFGLQADGHHAYTRARSVLTEADDTGPLESAPGRGRIALLVVQGGRVPLGGGSIDLRLPRTAGSGEEAAASLLAQCVSPVGGGLDLLGFSTRVRAGRDVEIWLYEGPPAVDEAEAWVWMPLQELMERVGSPRLRDPDLVSALRLLAESELGAALLGERVVRSPTPTLIPPEPAPSHAGEDSGASRFLNPDLSTLEFNQRVLEMAEDPAVPLAERLRFLAISARNLDEFFVVRIGRLKHAQDVEGPGEGTGGIPRRLLRDILAVRVRALVARQYRLFRDVLRPELAAAGVRCRRWDDLDEARRQALSERFHREIFPLLTPRAMSASPGHPFPTMESLGLSLAVALTDRAGGHPRLAHVPIPSTVPRFLPMPGTHDVVPVEEVVATHGAELFPGSTVVGIHTFRVSRSADIAFSEDGQSSLLSAVEAEVDRRDHEPVVRIEVERSMPIEVRAYLRRELRREGGGSGRTPDPADVYEVDGPLDLTCLSELAERELPRARFPRFEARCVFPAAAKVLDVLAERDVLLHHPYDDFDQSVGRFLREAASDPEVVSIKLTLYRTARTSRVVEALLDAARAGKDVSVFVEVKARFDETRNIRWTHRLADAGVHVVYGVVGYKTHAKTALLVRREAEGLRRYVHVGTGNYNASTASLYSDVGLMTSDPGIGEDLHDFFNELTGSVGPPSQAYRRVLVAPHTLAPAIERMVAREIDHVRAGRRGRIRAKLNGLADAGLIQELYEASQAGVQVQLIVRSICTLRPDVVHLSERIEVRSILGRFLEHARIYQFGNAGRDEYYIGSADWRPRNLHRRVEVVAPVDDPAARARLARILDAEWRDPRAWILRRDGAWERLRGEGSTAQDLFLSGDGDPGARPAQPTALGEGR